jgi:methanogenic corrinoid protein MtbC1
MINFNTENKKIEKFEQFRDEYIKLIFNNELDRALKFILNQKNIICGTIEGEYHEIGIKMISDLLYAEGFNINYLGTNVPIKSYMRFLNKNNFDAILISVTLKKNLDNLKKLVKSIKKEDNLKKLMVIVGGYPFYEDSNLYKKIGVDFFGNDIDDIQFYLKYEKERNL